MELRRKFKGNSEGFRRKLESFKDGVCVVCGSKDAGYYDLCPNCQDKPIPDYEAFHVAQLFNVLHKAVLSDMMIQLSKAYDAGNGQEATAAYKDYCFSYGTPGRLYYNDQKVKADRVKDPTPGSLRYMLKVYG